MSTQLIVLAITTMGNCQLLHNTDIIIDLHLYLWWQSLYHAKHVYGKLAQTTTRRIKVSCLFFPKLDNNNEECVL